MIRKTPLPAIALIPLLILLLAGCADDTTEKIPFGLETEVVTSAPRVTQMAFAPDGRMFFAEQVTGDIRVLGADGQAQAEPFAHLDVVSYLEQLDWGLTGLALDPGFETNHYVYALYMEPMGTSQPPAGPTGRPNIVRFTEKNGVATDQTVISADFPVTPFEHPGYNGSGNIHFGPDGYLYVSIGDYDYPQETSLSQDLSSPVGKLLRIDPKDGSAPKDNPFASRTGADPRVFAYGFREPFDFAFHPETGAIYATDNTTVTCEELNIIEAGANYGWSNMGEFPYSDCEFGTNEKAIHYFAREDKGPGDFISFVEVSGLEFVPATKYPQMGESLFVCESHRSPDAQGQQSPGVLRRLVLGGPDFDQVTSSDRIVKDCRGDVAVSPDGAVYYANDTEIRKLVSGPDANEQQAPALSPP